MWWMGSRSLDRLTLKMLQFKYNFRTLEIYVYTNTKRQALTYDEWIYVFPAFDFTEQLLLL